MSNQLQITGGAKVRNLEGVLTGTSGVVSSLGINVPSGIPQLDGSGKILVSQLPNSVMEYKGTWDASTNTPTLVDGTGNAGDVYLCNVAGTVNFGAGPITFYVGDQVLYSGTVWQRASGATGSVTSVALTESGDALNITGSPITTSGTINIGFAGTGSQYIKGDGTLATFPTTIDEAKRLITEVYNSTGATLTKGTVVYINGGQGNLPTVTKAQANNDANSAQTYGVVQDDITNNNNGFVVVLGSLTDLDTSAYVVGTQLYLSGTTAGAWTSTKPSAPIHLVYVAIVVRSHPTQGVVEVRIQNGYELEELHDVAISAPVNNQGIFYNSSNDLWENKSIATALGYTPANDALVVHLAGTETITGDKTFSGDVTFTSQYVKLEGASSTVGNTLNIKQFSSNLVSGVGYSSIGAIGNTKFTFYLGNTTAFDSRQFYLDGVNLTVNTPRTYTLPDLSGTLALLEGSQTFSGAKTFSTSVNNDDGLKIKLGSASNLTAGYLTMSAYGETSPLPDRTILRIGTAATQATLFKLQNTGSYTYDFPATNGTIALTSNLSSYVPYTGATTDVNLGSYTLSSAGISTNIIYANGSGLTPGTILLKQSTVPFTASGYNGIYANSTTYGFIASSGATYKQAVFSLSGLTDATLRTFTLPDASGTLALTSNLSSYVPYTGATTNVDLGASNNLTANIIYAKGGLSTDFGVLLKSGLVTTQVGYLNLSASKVSSTSQINLYTDSGFYFALAAPNTANYTYTFPASSGTVALTSNLSSYLPLSGGTLTGALNGTSATFSSIVTATADSNAAAFIALARSADDLSQIRFNNNANSNTNAIISVNKVGSNGGEFSISTKPDGSPLSTRLTIASTGATTFSSSVTAGTYLATSAGNELRLYNGSNNSYSQLYNSAGTGSSNIVLTTNTGIDYQVRSTNGASGNHVFKSYNTAILTLDGGTNAATFASSVGINGASTSYPLNVSGAASNGQFVVVSNVTNTGYGYNFVANQGGLQSLWGSETNGAFIGTNSNHYFYFLTNGSEKMRINSSGNVGIGTASLDAYATRFLQIHNTSGNSALRLTNNTTGTTKNDGFDIELRTSDVFINSRESTFPMIFGTQDTERMRITSSGRVIINSTTQSDAFFNITTNSTAYNPNGYNGNNSAIRLYCGNATSAYNAISFGGGSGGHEGLFGTVQNSSGLAEFVWQTYNGSVYGERMRITSGGFTKISNNGTYNSSTGGFHEIYTNNSNSYIGVLTHAASTNPYGFWLNYSAASPNSTTNEFLYFTDSTNSKFIVWSNGSVVNRTGSYGTISDIKFKENIVDATPKLSDLLKLKVRNFNMIGQEEKHIGFIAQEFEEVFPKMVDTSIDKDSGDEFKSIKTSVLVPMLVKAIQELKQELDELKAKIN